MPFLALEIIRCETKAYRFNNTQEQNLYLTANIVEPFKYHYIVCDLKTHERAATITNQSLKLQLKTHSLILNKIKRLCCT